MRILLSLAVASYCAVAAFTQDEPAAPAAVYRIHKLTLVSSDLSRA